MLLYRVFPHSPSAREGDAGSATYDQARQGAGRWDNPALYRVWYLSTSPEGAVGETFGNLATWSAAMLEHPTGMQRALAVFSAPDDLSLFDFDDPANLVRIGMRPTQVVIRNAAYTQQRAAALFAEQHDGAPSWAGLRWWSFHRPTWTNVALWQAPDRPAPFTLEDVEELDLASPAVVEASRALAKPLPAPRLRALRR